MSLPKRARPLIFKYALFKAFILSTGVLCPVFADDTSTTVGDLSARIDDLERQLSEGGVKVDEASPGSHVTADDLNRLKEEVRSLKGESEDIRALRAELRNLREDIKDLKQENSDLRIQKTSKKASPSDDLDEKPTSKRKDDSFKQTKNPSSQSGASASDDEADTILMLLEKSAPGKDIEADRESATMHAEETAPTLPTGNAEAQYNEAFALHDKGAYKEAERAFGYFIKTYPNDPLVPKAMYWKAESCFQQKKYKDAKILFVNAYKKNPKGPKAPDCLLKLGEILAIQGKKDDARTAWRKLKQDFPHMTSEMKEELASLHKTHGIEQKSVKAQKPAPS